MRRTVAILMTRALVAFVATTLGVYPVTAHATPETWIVPSLSFEGVASGERFGDAIACSVASVYTNNRSFVAVGAPQASGGDGAVYLFDPSSTISPSTAYQTIRPPTAGQGGRFGASIAFVHDIPGSGGTGDDRDDLIIAEPGTGKIYIYESALVGIKVTYTDPPCHSHQEATDFGAKMLGIRGPFAEPTPPIWEHLVVSSPNASAAANLGVRGLDLSSACTTQTIPAGTGRFQSLGNTSHYGSALAEIVGGLGDQTETPQRADVLVGHPNFILGGTGRVQLLDSNLGALDPEVTVRQVGEEDFGSAIGGYHTSSTFAISSPGRNGGRGGIDIHEGSATVACSVEQPPGESSSEFGQSLVHLNRAFPNLFSGNTDTTFAAFRSEQTTNGSVALFSIYNGACSNLYQVNNCIEDANQEQGKALEGGNDCIIKPGGGPAKHMLLIGAPGWSFQKGRVDIVASGDELPAAQTCGSSPAATPTSAPGEPAPTPTPIPAPTPLPIQPGSAVPPATVEVSGNTVVFVLPEVQATLTTAQRKKALKLLGKRKIKGAKAEKALNELTLIFEVTVTSTSSKKSITLKTSSDLIPLASASKKRQYRSRLNRVSAPKLPPGSYTATWKATIYTKKPLVAIGATKTSPPTKFTK